MTFLKELIVLALVLITTEALSKDSRKMVAIIDTGISASLLNSSIICKDSYADFTGMGITDYHGHGTNVAGIIAKKLNPKTHCIVPIKYWHTETNPNGKYTTFEVYDAMLSYLKALKPRYINFSAAGMGFVYKEYNIYYDLMESGTKIVVAAGNKAADLGFTCDTFPACYFLDEPNFYVVGASDMKLSNKNGPVNVLRKGKDKCGFNVCMSGTSQAAAEFTAELISKER